jgi:putative hydrolase of the HAD superfamily
MAKAKKPNPRIFQLAMKLSGANLENSLMIGDNIEVDIKGAEDFGWRAIHFDPLEQSEHGMSVKSLRELPNILL